MITITCDMCGEELSRINNLVEVELTYNGIVTMGRGGFHDAKKQLCVTCATRLLNWMQARLEEGGVDNA